MEMLKFNSVLRRSLLGAGAVAGLGLFSVPASAAVATTVTSGFTTANTDLHTIGAAVLLMTLTVAVYKFMQWAI